MRLFYLYHQKFTLKMSCLNKNPQVTGCNLPCFTGMFLFIYLTSNLHCVMEFDRVSVLFVGEILGFENLVLGIFDFVHALIETPRHRSLMKKYVEQLIYYVFHYMQMTEEQVI